MTYGIRGQDQVVQYGSSASPLYHYTRDDNGLEQKTDGSVSYSIYNPAGTLLASATIVSALTATTEGWIAYDAQTAEFEVGETVTIDAAGTVSYGVIREQRKSGTAGKLYLTDVDGTPADNKTLTTPGGGSATTDGALYTNCWKFNLNASGTSTYPVAKNYYVRWSYAISSFTHYRNTYFDVAYYPATPWITSTDIDEEYPALIGLCPDGWRDWTPAIKAAHRKLCGMLDALGEQASFFVKREQEMFDISLAFTRAQISKKLGDPIETQDHWKKEAAEAWAGRGEFVYDDDADADVGVDAKVISSGFTR